MGDTCPAARALWAISLAAVAVPGLAADLHQRVQACAAIAEDDRRLACFDALAAGEGRPTGPEAARAKEAAFGMEQSLMAQSTKAPDAVSEIRAPVRRIGTMANGWMIIDLDNGQTWAQAEALRNPVPLAVGDEVSIRRGALGSFMLSTADNRSMRVRRKN